MPKTPAQKAQIRRFSIFLVGAFVILMGLAAAAIKNAPPPPPELPDLGHVPLFHLTDQKGQPYSESALGGRVWVANFIFTRCPQICPLFTQRMAKVQGELSDLTNVHYVSFSVDPAYDTPERLAAYARDHHVESPRWAFLTGKTDDIQKTVVDGFKISLLHEKGTDAGTDFTNIVHGVHFVLVDQQGVIRGYYDSNDAKRVEAL
jgi:protein SCO1/2